MQESKIFISRFIKKDGKVDFKLNTDKELFKVLCDKMKNGAVVDVLIDFSAENGTLSQIAKLKAGTREISKETGYTFIEVENLIKKNAGLYNEITEVYESFGNCSSEKLSGAIQVMINIGENCNLNLR